MHRWANASPLAGIPATLGLIQPLVRGCPGCAAFGSSIVTKLDEEDNGDHHPHWCDEEVHQQLGTGFWAKTAGEVRGAD
jgi:hypothetical protein